MEINDYSNRLSEARTRYNKATNEMRESYNKDLEHAKNTHKNIEKNQLKVFNKQKQELEETNKKNLDRYEKSLTKELDQRTERYRDNLANEKKQFAQDRHATMKNYKHKLDEISTSFDTASKEKEKLNNARKEMMEERFEDGLTTREKDFNEKLAKMQRKATDSVKEFRDQQTDEKRDLVGRYENEKKQLVQDANIARNKASGVHQAELQRLRDTHKQLQESQKNSFESSVENLSNNKEKEVTRIRGNFEELTNNIQERNAAVLKNQNKEHKEDKRNLENDFATDRNQLERKTSKMINDTKEEHKVNGTDELKKRFDTRIDDLNHEIDNIVERHVASSEKRAEKTRKNIEDAELRHAHQIEKKEKEFRDYKQGEMTEAKDRFESTNDKYKKKVLKLETTLQDKSVEHDQEMREKISDQRREYAKQLNRMSQKNLDTVNDLNKDFAQEKTKLLQSERKRAHDDKKDLLKTMKESFAKKEKSLTTIIEDKTKKNQDIINSYENQLSMFQKKSADEINSITVLEHQKREALREALKNQVETLSLNHQKEIEKIRATNDRKIAEIKSNADLKTFKLTQRYENMLNNERKNALKNLKIKLGEANVKMERLAQAHKLDRETLIQQYESKIDQLIRQSRLENEMTDAQKAT